MNKIWTFIKKHFLTRKFITFGIIGVVNTLIHMLVYGLIYNLLSDQTNYLSAMIAFIANAIAFVSASTFSYFANAYFTFKPKHKTTVQFSAVILVFLARWLVSSLMAAGFDYTVVHWIGLDYEIYPLAKYIAPFLASALLIPVAYLALNIVFKKTSDIKENQNKQGV
ncbi:GtrA family protein [Hujiaoplasma nucleasis]|uniref:GtrA family protein n=1 Tax=Hujiaoplasma nucleasis TaxID=2725268 RepID=A0A7L6N7H1_9MOLU|nr:GtrA family protein [Hujiaoplasma nucleasis]QLY40484.1 GtrA family protein [Hujiaoplasma nucleasis]